MLLRLGIPSGCEVGKIESKRLHLNASVNSGGVELAEKGTWIRQGSGAHARNRRGSGFDQPPKFVLPIGRTDPLLSFVAQEIDVDAKGVERRQGRPEVAGPGDVLLCRSILLGPDRIDVDHVTCVAMAVGGVVLTDAGDRSAYLEDDRVRQR